MAVREGSFVSSCMCGCFSGQFSLHRACTLVKTFVQLERAEWHRPRQDWEHRPPTSRCWKPVGICICIATTSISRDQRTHQSIESCLRPLHLFQPQVVHEHVAADGDPPPAEPHHLADVRARHCLARRCPAASPEAVHEDERGGAPPAVLVLVVAAAALVRSAAAPPDVQRRGPQRGEDVDHPGVLARHVDRGQGVHVDGASPAGPVGGQGGDEVAGAVVEGDVVRVGGDAALVEGYDDVDRGLWGLGVRVVFVV